MAVNRARNSWDKGYQQARILEREIGNKLFEYSKLSTVNTSEHDEGTAILKLFILKVI